MRQKNLTSEGVCMLLRSIRRYNCSTDWDGDGGINHEESPTGLYILYEDIADLIQHIRRTSANDPLLH